MLDAVRIDNFPVIFARAEVMGYAGEYALYLRTIGSYPTLLPIRKVSRLVLQHQFLSPGENKGIA